MLVYLYYHHTRHQLSSTLCGC